MIVSSVWLHSFPHAYALANYAPGVKAGDEITYGKFSVNNTTPYPPFPGNVSSLAIQVKTVDTLTNTVTAVLVTTYSNRSQTNATLTGTTDTGQGNLAPYLIAGGLTAGDSLFKNPGYLGVSVNETVNEVYAGALRTVNVLNITYQATYVTLKAAYYWDAKTGLLVEAYQNANYTSPSGFTITQIFFEATATNIWTPDTSPDFSFDASAQTPGPHLGETTSYRLDLASLNQFTGTIGLSPNLLGTLLSHPPSVTISSTSLAVSLSNPMATSVLTVASNSSTTIGTYLISVNATSGAIEHDTIIAVTIAPPDFTIDANPGNLTLSEGSSKSSTITVASRGLFTGTVTLQIQSYGSITPTITPSLVTLNATNVKGEAILSVVANAGVPPSVTTVYVDAVSGSISRSIYVQVNVTGPDFRITATPSFLNFKEGQSATSTITLTSILGFAGSVTLSTSFYGPVTASLATPALVLTAGGTVNTTLTVSTPAAGPPGVYSVYVSGSSANNIFRSAYVNVNVTGPDFRFRSSSYFMTLQTGQTGNATLTLSAVGGFSGVIDVSANSQSGPFTASVTPPNVTLNNSTQISSTALLVVAVPKGVTPGYYSLSLSATSGNLVRTLYMTVQIIGPDFSLSFNPGFLTISQGGSGRSQLSLSGIDNFTGSVSLTTSTPFGLQTLITPSNVALSPGGTANSTLTVDVPLSMSPGYYFLNVIGTSGQIQHSNFFQVQVVGPDFSVSSFPPFLTLRQGETANSTISLTSFDNFKAPVAITTTTYSGSRISVSPSITTLILVANGTVTTVLTFSAPLTIPPGSNFFQVTATGGNLTRSTYVQVNVIGPDFSLSVFPFSIGLKPGDSTTATVTLNSLDGFSGNVTLSTVSTLNATLNNHLMHLVANGTATTTLTIQVPQTLQGGGYYVMVNATSGFTTHTYFVNVQVITPDFALQANPFSLQVKPGSSAQSTIAITSLNGFNGTVTLSTFQFASSGIDSTLSESNVTLTSARSASVTLTVTASPSAPSQSFYLNIQGIHGNVTRYTYVFVSVTSPDFSLSFNPPSTLLVNPGGSAQSTITLTSFNRFNGTVTLSTLGFFSGVNATLSSRNVTLTSGGSATVTLTVSASPTAVSQSSYLSVRGTSGNLTRFISIFVIVTSPDFSLSSSPTFLSIPRGSSSNSTLTISSISGFSGNVTLSASIAVPGFNSTFTSTISATLSSTVVFVASGGPATSDISIVVPSSTVPGFYGVILQATSGTIVRTLFIQVQVTGTSFGLRPDLSFLQLNAGTIGNTAIFVTALNGFSGPVSLSASSSPAGLNVTLNPATVTLNSTVVSTSAPLTIRVPAHPVAGYYLVTVTGSGSGLNVTSFVTVFVTAFDFSLNAQPGSLTVFQGSFGASTITITSLNGLSGFVDLRALLLPPTLGISVSLGSGIPFVQNNQTVSTSLTVSASPTAAIGNYTIVLVGSFNTPSGTPVGHALNVTFTIAPAPDFAVIANPPTISIVQDSSGSSTLNVTSLHSFAGPITLTSTMSLQGLTASITNSTIAVTAGRTTLTVLTVSAGTNVVGYFTITVTAEGGGVVHSIIIQVYVAAKPDFTLSASPSSLTIQAGSSGATVMSLASLNGFVGPVQIFPQVSAAGVSFAPNVSTASLSAGGTASMTITIAVGMTASSGTYMVTFIGNATTGSHLTSLLLTVLPPPDFTLTPSTLGLTFAAGTSASLNIAISPTNGFNGAVALSSNAPSGFTSTFSPNPVLGGSGTSNLTLSVSSTVAVGNYTVIVTGIGGSFSHTASIHVTVSAASKVTLTVSQVSWTHRLSLSKSGGMETWTMLVKNTGTVPAYFQIATAGNSTSSAQPFSVKTPVAVLAPGASMTITLSQPFTNASIGLKYSFAVSLMYGSGTYASGSIISPSTILVTKGTFSIVR